MPQLFSSLLALLFFLSGPVTKGNAAILQSPLAAEETVASEATQVGARAPDSIVTPNGEAIPVPEGLELQHANQYRNRATEKRFGAGLASRLRTLLETKESSPTSN